MALTLAFDVYGTLINTHGVLTLLSQWIDKDATAFSQTWRDKQLEYSFRRGLMKNYQNFDVCTRDALEYTCQFYQIPLTQAQKQSLLDEYQRLPAFDDVKPALIALKQSGYRLFAFSNGNKASVENLLNHAQLMPYSEGVISCEDLHSFKPDPAVYQHFIKQSNALIEDTWLISSNPFDVIGAISSGIKGLWVQRSSGNVFDPWHIQPTQVVTSLTALKAVLSQSL